jgi:tetratricopeptide (TPR) repeat protein
VGEAGARDEILSVFDLAVPAVTPAGPSPLIEQILVHQRAGRRSEALAACRRLLAVERGRADVMALAGKLAMELGDVAQAAEHYAAAAACRPDVAEAHYNLGNALMRLGRSAEAAAAYRRACGLRPDLLPAHANLGNALYALGRYGEAAASYREAVRLAPNAAETHRNLGLALHEASDLAGSIACHRRAVALKPDWVLALQSLANGLMEAGAWRDAVAACDAWLGVRPASIEALGLKAVALEELGERAGARHLVDFERFVQVLDFAAPPEGFADMAAFNAALARHALEHPTLRVPPASDPRYHCASLRITEEFLAAPKGPAAGFERMIEAAVDGYIREFAQRDPTHPFLVDPPRRWQLTSWAAVLDGQGNLNPHVHYAGYISGVYYPRIPQPIGAPDEGKAGWFEFGGGPDRFPCTAAPETRSIRPREGMMLLFPSYFYHRTVPFRAAEPRISIAFDAVPVG